MRKLYPLFLRAAVYVWLFLLKISSLFELVDILLFMLWGRFFKIEGGWLLFLLMYTGVLFSFMNGSYVLDVRSRVMSKKFVFFLLAVTVMFKPKLLKILQISFFVCSVCRGVSSHNASPSSRYKPQSIFKCAIFDSKKSPTSSHVSAPSKLPIVTSNGLCCFTHGVLLWYKYVFFECFMISMSCADMLACREANDRALSNKSSDIDG